MKWLVSGCMLDRVTGSIPGELAVLSVGHFQRRTSVRHGSLLLLLLMAIGCVSSPRSVLDAKLEDGRRVGELMPPAGKGALLVYEAATCFSCDSDLPLWANARARAPERIKILLTSPVTEADRRAFVLTHIEVAGVIAASSRSSREFVGTYLVENGRIIASARTKTEREKRQLWRQIVGTPSGQRATEANAR